MHLSPADRDRLLTFSAAQLASARLARGLLLNAPEATALVASAVVEAARDGCRLAEALEAGGNAVSADQVLAGVADVVRVVHVEAVFDDGTRLVVVDEPFGPPTAGGPGSVRTAETAATEPAATEPAPTTEPAATVTVTNTAAVPV
ncbi:MAG: urease subunit gamma, partial [Steroidobacteraceae bacterium]